MKNRKWIRYLLVVLLIGFFLFFLHFKLWGANFVTFITEYQIYLTHNPEHRADLFEKIMGGIFTGLTTFFALFITIIHENRKNREIWKKEREEEEKRRLWEIQPVLNLNVVSISAARRGTEYLRKDVINVGKGDKYIYLIISIKNRGNGECKNIYLNNKAFSISQLGNGEEKEFPLYLVGVEENQSSQKVKIEFAYQDVFGHYYIQKFSLEGDLALKDPSKIRVEMQSPKLVHDK